MKIGVSGHRRREGADWTWVRGKMAEEIVRARNVTGYTSLAPGADQIFADIVLGAGKPLVAVVPVCRGRIELEDGARADFDRFCVQAAKVIRVEGATPDDAFYKTGKRVADAVDQMIFVWDGAPARGPGGTAEVVAYARSRRKRGLILDPIRLTVRDLDAEDR